MLPAGANAVLRLELTSAVYQRLNPLGRGTCQPKVRGHPGADGSPRRGRFKEVGGEAIEGGEPVVISRDRIDRLVEAFERQVELLS